MINILLSGCCGTMGHVVAAAAAKTEDCQIAAGFDRTRDETLAFPVILPGELPVQPVDVIIDFSHPANFNALLALATKLQKPLVLATTGFGENQLSQIYQTAQHLPIFFSANMSLGVSLLRELCTKAAQVLGENFEVEIVEKHHNQKVDAPSGTAIMLADAVADGLNYAPQYVYDRHSHRTKRERTEIGMHSIRGGSIVGEHDVLFIGRDEVITLSHGAYSKEIFATGALSAAKFMAAGKAPGLYTMSDLIETLTSSH